MREEWRIQCTPVVHQLQTLLINVASDLLCHMHMPNPLEQLLLFIASMSDCGRAIGMSA